MRSVTHAPVSCGSAGSETVASSGVRRPFRKMTFLLRRVSQVHPVGPRRCLQGQKLCSISLLRDYSRSHRSASDHRVSVAVTGRDLIIAERADSPLGTYLGIGIVWMVVVQAVINMSVVVRFLPTTGIPLPFISVGGSSLMVMLAASGILLNVSKHRRPN